MNSKKINSLIRWWVTPKLPPEDIFAKHNFLTQWIIHPIKRRLARAYLKFLRKNGNIKVIGITGSTGKTTTTEILASILNKSGEVVWSKESVDPVYNIPNTILRCNSSTKYLILEMSVEYKNEMDYYLWLAKPDIGIITNINATHLEFLKTEEGVAKEKGKLIEALNCEAIAVINKKDKILKGIINKTKAKVVFFGPGSDFSCTSIKLNTDLSTDFTLHLYMNKKNVHMNAYGHQFVNNALAAVAAASSLGISLEDIVEGICSFKPPAHRLNIVRSSRYGLIFDDTYNSNPKAVSESLATFNFVSKGLNKMAIIGDMLELGDIEENAHRTLGVEVGKYHFKCLIGVGNAAKFIIEEASKELDKNKCYLVSDYIEALTIIKPMLNRKTALFVKGSRSIHLDKLVKELI